MYASTSHYYNETPSMLVSAHTDSAGHYVRVSINCGDIGLNLSPDEAKKLRDSLSIALADLAVKEPTHA